VAEILRAPAASRVSAARAKTFSRTFKPTPIYSVSEFLEVGFDLQDLFAQVILAVHDSR
jgi:hypothetical protein